MANNIRDYYWGSSDIEKYVYGIGTVGKKIYHLINSKGVALAGFMDHRILPEPFVGNIPVTLPEKIPASKREQIVIFIAIHNRDADIAGIINHLKSLGFNQIVTMFDLMDAFPEELDSHYWLAPRSLYLQLENELKNSRNLLFDKKSRDIFDAILEFRMSGDYIMPSGTNCGVPPKKRGAVYDRVGYSLLPEPDLKRQYFPEDLPLWKEPMRLMDCGAYNGDTVAAFISNGIQIGALAAYEPDLDNFRTLAAAIRKTEIEEISLWPCGLYSNTTQLGFTSGGGEGSSIDQSGNNRIQCVSIDESAPNFAPTLIKMDIEGVELEALKGAERTISQYQPGLAISIYHKPNDLWEIPLYIAGLAHKHKIQYKYFVRSHGRNSFETVFYAVPGGSQF